MILPIAYKTHFIFSEPVFHQNLNVGKEHKMVETIKLLTIRFFKTISRFFLWCVYKCIGWAEPETSPKGNPKMSFAYPTDFPIMEAKNVIDVIRSGDLLGQKEALAHDAWVVQGYAQSMLIGTPESTLASQAADLKNAEMEPLAALEKVVADAESGAISSQIAIPWMLIAKYAIEILLKLLEE
jgi:hypothetical protein